MYKIKLYDHVAPEGMNAFDKNNYLLADNAEKPDGILVHSTILHNIELNDELKFIVRIGAGVNTIPVDKCTKQGIAVFNCPGGNANAVKELTIAAIIMLMRNGFSAMEWVKSLPSEDTEAGSVVEKGKSKFRGSEILGKTISIVGVGAIGSRMAKACYDLGMKVYGYDPYLSHARVTELSQYCTFVPTLEECISKGDIVTVHTPLNEETKDMISKKEIASMKDGVYLINYARGPILNEEAVNEAIASGKIKGFATDFPTPKQMQMKGVIFTPHLGAGTPEADVNCAIMAARQAIDYIENGNITNSVNMPNLNFARSDGARVCIYHDNKVGMLGKITDVVSSMNLNIENLANKGRGDIAYTILDFNGSVPSYLKDKIEAIDGVIRVRVIE